ncbi:hypothetical protein AMJ85_03240 [candidate division BRC1 bacterium SM23_51]|nr:MAG: hypothetical protein AMJ85_03240 [candidate division BRC1 bacterium SM23_51]
MTAETGQLQRVLSEGQLAIVVECIPPAARQAPDAEAVKKTAAVLRDKVDAVGVVDNRSEILMSAVATAAILQAEGIEPIVNVTTRDRNRIALMSDVIGARALGLRNFLCTSGDHQTLGRERAARNVFDLDSIQLLATLDRLRRDGVVFGDESQAGSLSHRPCDLYLGAVASPDADPQELQAIRLAKKVEAGADFLITQPVFDVDRFGKWLDSLEPSQIAEKAAILAGILVPPSAARTREIRENVPAGWRVEIPDAVIERLESVRPEQQRDEAISLAVELIGRLRALKDIRGFYLMTDGDAAAAVEVIERAGLRSDR